MRHGPNSPLPVAHEVAPPSMSHRAAPTVERVGSAIALLFMSVLVGACVTFGAALANWILK